MKARDLARYILSLPEEQQEMEIEICTGSYECDPTTKPVELYEYEHMNWKYLLFTEKTPEKPIQGEVVYDEEATKELKRNMLRPNEGLMF